MEDAQILDRQLYIFYDEILHNWELRLLVCVGIGAPDRSRYDHSKTVSVTREPRGFHLSVTHRKKRKPKENTP